jgi:hypothetical protein
LADAQRTSWIRADDKISVDTLSKPGFDVQWKKKLENQPRGLQGLAQGVSASGVTLFVPMSIVTGSSNNVYGIDNDTGYVVWQRHFDAAMPAATPAAQEESSLPTRIVRLDASATAAARGLSFGRGAVGYRSLLGEPGEGVCRSKGAQAVGTGAGDPGAAARSWRRSRSASAQSGARGGPPPADRIPGAPPSSRAERSASSGLRALAT